MDPHKPSLSLADLELLKAQTAPVQPDVPVFVDEGDEETSLRDAYEWAKAQFEK